MNGLLGLLASWNSKLVGYSVGKLGGWMVGWWVGSLVGCLAS